MNRLALALLLTPLTTSAALAEIQTKNIEYQVGSDTFVGVLAWDDALAKDSSPVPGVLVCPEWWGNNEYSQSRARQLAELGYVALAIDMYGKGEDGKPRTTTDPKQAGEWSGAVMKDAKVRDARVTAGLKALTDQKMVDKQRVAAIGYCMGGSVAMALARTGADLKAVVAFHASTVSAQDEAQNRNIKGTVLVCHGQDDAFVQPGELDKFHKQMKDAKIDYALYSYSGAVHAFTNPNADKAGVPGVAYNKNADHRSWEAMKALFEEKFGPAIGKERAADLRRKHAETQASVKARNDESERQRQPRGENPGDIPAPLTDAQIAAMDRGEAMREMAARRTYAQKNPALSKAIRQQLENDVTRLRDRMETLRAGAK